MNSKRIVIGCALALFLVLLSTLFFIYGKDGEESAKELLDRGHRCMQCLAVIGQNCKTVCRGGVLLTHN